ncbi:hypothetical protein Dimus_023258, partial [Dionaea muscipula]
MPAGSLPTAEGATHQGMLAKELRVVRELPSWVLPAWSQRTWPREATRRSCLHLMAARASWPLTVGCASRGAGRWRCAWSCMAVRDS